MQSARLLQNGTGGAVMFEKYTEELNDFHYREEAIEQIKRRQGFTQKKQVISYLTKNIPLEKKFQTDVMKGVRKAYPRAYVVKLSLAHYSTAGIPDVMVILDGHYFAFEIKRPFLRDIDPEHYGPTKLQIETMRQLEQAGASCGVVSYPEEAIAVIKKWKQS